MDVHCVVGHVGLEYLTRHGRVVSLIGTLAVRKLDDKLIDYDDIERRRITKKLA